MLEMLAPEAALEEEKRLQHEREEHEAKVCGRCMPPLPVCAHRSHLAPEVTRTSAFQVADIGSLVMHMQNVLRV